MTIDLIVVWYYMNLNSQNQFLFYYAIAYTASVNNVVVTVLYPLRALHRRIIVYRIMYDNIRQYYCQKLKT